MQYYLFFLNQNVHEILHLMMFSLTLYPSAIECQVMNEIASKSLQLLSQSLKCLLYVCAKLLLISM